MNKRLGVALLGLCLTVSMTAPIGSAEAEPAAEEARGMDGLLGRQIGEVFDARATGETKKLDRGKGNTLFESLFETTEQELFDSLSDQSKAGGGFVVLADGLLPVVEVVPATQVGIDQEGTAVLRVAHSGEYTITRTGGKGVLDLSFSDPGGAGRWLLDSVDGQVRVRLIEFTYEFPHDDVGNPGFVDPQTISDEVDKAEGVEPFEFGDPEDLPSSFPDETWLLPDGSRAFSDDELRAFERQMVEPRRRIETQTDSYEIIDVAVFDAEWTSNFTTVSNAASDIIDAGNALMMGSDQDTRFRLVGVDALSANFNAPFPADSDDLMEEAQGLSGASQIRDRINFMRARYHADLVIVIIQSNGMSDADGKAGGIPGGSGGSATLDDAIVIIHEDTIAGDIVPAHELAHVLGGAHESSGAGTFYANAHSISLAPTQQRQTVMWSAATSTSLMRLSTPDQRYSTSTSPLLGTSTRDNLRAVNVFSDNVGDHYVGTYCASHEEGHAGFVNDLYPRMIGTVPDNAEESTEISRLSSGILNQSIYTTASSVSSVGDNNGKSEVGFQLTRLYRTLFGRLPDFTGYKFWLGQRWGGWSIQTVTNHFFASNEYTTKHGTRSTASFVDYMFLHGNGIPNPTAGARNWWINYTNANGRQAAVILFMDASQPKAYQKPQVETVQLYTGLFERAADTGGFNYYSGLIRNNSGWDQERVANTFLRASEYRSTC